MSGLNRIILINTHLPGMVELKLDGHSNICGTNASGKTTLQRLIPVFYGEYPSRMVPSTRDSFEKWYLPRDDSYIIFEYRRMDNQMCQAVIAAASDRNGVRYRFIDNMFQLDDYLKSRDGDQLTFHSMDDFGRALKRCDIANSRQLNTREFRGIIQNDRITLNSGSSQSQLRSYARQYSLCDNEHTLRHIEKLARAVHSKEGKMETIKSMIAAILEEDGVTPPASSLNPQKVESWIRESLLIQGFEAIRPEFDHLEQQYNQLLANELRLGGLKQGYMGDESEQLEKLQLAKDQIEQLGLQLKQHEEQWKAERDELNLQLSTTKGELQSDENELESIEAQYQDFQDKEIEQARANLDKIPAWRDDLSNLEARFRLLTEDHQNIESSYNERCHKIEQQHNRSLTQLNEQKDTYYEERNQYQEQIRDELRDLDNQFHAHKQTITNRFLEREHQLDLEQNEIKGELKGVTYTQDENKSLAIFEQRIQQTEENRELSQVKQEQIDKQEQQAKQQRNDADEQLRLAAKHVHECDTKRQSITDMLYPGHNTLMEFLRKEHPNWESTLGKVIHPELLQRGDLKPAISLEASASIYQVALELSAIEIPEYARSEQELKLQLVHADERLSSAQNQQELAEQGLNEASQALKSLRNQKIMAATECKNSRDDMKRLRDEKQNQQKQIDTALAKRRQIAQQKLEALQHQLGQQTNERDNRLDELKAQQGETRLEKQAHWDEVIGSLETQINQVKEEITQRQQTAKQELKACRDWYQAELKSRGIDDSEIGKIKQSIEKLELTIHNSERMRSEVVNYQAWYQSQWMQRKPLLQDQFSAHQTRHSEQQQQLNTANSNYKQQRLELEHQHLKTKVEYTESENNLDKLKGLLKRLSELQLPKQSNEQLGSLSERLNLGESLLHSREQLLTGVRDGVDRFDKEIVNQYGSSLAETWERSRDECQLVSESGARRLDYRKLVPELSRLINELVPQKVTAVKQLGRTYGRDLNNYYDVLRSIDSRIASQSARITREVDEELFLDGVSESAVKIRSRVSELEFWPELQAFVKAYDAWSREDFNTLPNEEYTSSMRRALEIIGRSALDGGISSLLGIELRLREGSSDLIIRTDRQLNESSSHGMAYLILCKFLLAFTRLLRGRGNTTIHWPIDELGTLAHNNIKKIFDACGNNQISVLGAFPNPDSEVLSLFSNRYIINKQTQQLQMVKPKFDPIAERLAQKTDSLRKEHN